MNLEPELADGSDVADPVSQKHGPVASDRPHLEVEGLGSTPSDGDRLKRGVTRYLKTTQSLDTFNVN